MHCFEVVNYFGLTQLKFYLVELEIENVLGFIISEVAQRMGLVLNVQDDWNHKEWDNQFWDKYGHQHVIAEGTKVDYSFLVDLVYLKVVLEHGNVVWRTHVAHEKCV